MTLSKFQPVLIVGATGNNRELVNGVFVPMHTKEKTRTVLVKVGRPDICLWANTGSYSYPDPPNTWKVSHLADISNYNVQSFCRCQEPAPLPSMVKQWNVPVKGNWEAQTEIVVSILVSLFVFYA